jgi:transcriptional regulator with XRE-family HTH domain
MTPFGEKVRALRAARGVTLKDMAAALRVSAAYLSALEHGRRGRPSWAQVQAIIGYFNVIWDEAEEIERLARLSHPRVVIDTSGLDPRATELANRLAEDIAHLTGPDLDRMNGLLAQSLETRRPRRSQPTRKRP